MINFHVINGDENLNEVVRLDVIRFVDGGMKLGSFGRDQSQ